MIKLTIIFHLSLPADPVQGDGGGGGGRVGAYPIVHWVKRQTNSFTRSYSHLQGM